MVIEGLKLMVLGMGVVFIFLLILFAVISLSAIILKPFTDGEVAVQHKKQAEMVSRPSQSVSGNSDDESILTAVISSAIARYQNDH